MLHFHNNAYTYSGRQTSSLVGNWAKERLSLMPDWNIPILLRLVNRKIRGGSAMIFLSPRSVRQSYLLHFCHEKLGTVAGTDSQILDLDPPEDP